MTGYRLLRHDEKPTAAGRTRLEVAVVSTTPEGTKAALRTARRLWRDLDTNITVLVVRMVPFPAPLAEPPVSPAFLEQQLRAIAAPQSGGDVRVKVLLCRDAGQAVRDALKPHSLVVVGGRKTWWPSQERSLARTLRKAGHRVVFAASR